MSLSKSQSDKIEFNLQSATVDWPERIVTFFVYAAVILVSLTFFLLIWDIGWNGLIAVDWNFLTTAPSNAGRRGGIGPIIVSTVLILCVCMAVALPIGLATAMYLSEYTAREGSFGRIVRRSLDILAGVPSIVFGLFGNAFFCIYLGLGFSILSGGLTLACMVLPLFIRSAEEGLRSVSQEYRSAAAALALSKCKTLFHVILPSAMPGIIVGLVLGVGRALAETAALIFTSGYVDRFPTSLMDSGRSLSIHIYDLSMNVPGGNRNAYAAAATLLALLLAINLSTSAIASYWQSSVTKGDTYR